MRLRHLLLEGARRPFAELPVATDHSHLRDDAGAPEINSLWHYFL